MFAASNPDYLTDHELVTSVYGYWPLFHDAEIMTLTMDRTRILFDSTANARIELHVYCMEMIYDKATNAFSFVNDNLVHFEFEEVDDVRLENFNHQNAILGLHFEEQPLSPSGNHSFRVVLEKAHGLHGSFIAGKGRVLSVKPCNELGHEIKQT